MSRKFSKVRTCIQGHQQNKEYLGQGIPSLPAGFITSHTGAIFCTKDKCLSQLTEISAKNPILPNSQRIISMRSKVICKSASKHSEEKSTPPPHLSTHIVGSDFKISTGSLVMQGKKDYTLTLVAMMVSTWRKILWISHLPNHLPNMAIINGWLNLKNSSVE